MNELENVKVLCFDVGGVLRDSSKAIHEGYRRGFEKHGLDFSFSVEEVWNLRGLERVNRSRASIMALLAVLKTENKMKEILGSDESENKLDEIISNNITRHDLMKIEDIRKEYEKFFDSSEAVLLIRKPKNLKEIFIGLKERYILTIFSNANLVSIERDLDDIIGLISFVVCEDDLKNKKPNPEGLLKITKKFGIRSNELAFIGDTASDVKTAESAKCISVAVLSGMGKREWLNQADFIFKDIKELRDYLLNA